MRLSDLLKKENIQIPVQATVRDAAIKELTQLMADAVNDSAQAYEAVLEREKIMTTGVGNGIAIPHCKHSSCPDFTIALGIANPAIDFKAIDDQHVNLIFLLLGPENNPGTHIKLLSRISRLMSNKDIRERLGNCKTADEAFQIICAEEENFPDID